MDNEKMKELEIKCRPLVSYLRENYNPYCSIVITTSGIRVDESTVSIPIKRKNDQPKH